MSAVKMTITVDDEHLPQTAAIADRLTRDGFQVDRVSKRGGAIFISAEPELAQRIRRVEGIQDVQSANDFQLPPMHPAVPQ